MKSNYDKLDESFNIGSSIIKSDENLDSNELDITPLKNDVSQDIEKDYAYTRSHLYSLIEKGQEAINGIMEIASEGGSPRAYEVAGQLIKNVSDVTDKLIDLQKKLKDVEETTSKTTNNTTNNAIFVGSTSELSKILKQGFLNNKE
jgi:hypothetical protein